MSIFKGKRCYTYDELMSMLEEAYKRGQNKVKLDSLKEAEYIKELESKLSGLLPEVEQNLQRAKKQLKINASTELLLLQTIKEQQELLDKITLRLEIYKNKIEDTKLKSEISHISSTIEKTKKKSVEIKKTTTNNNLENSKNHLGQNIDKKF